ncbi:MAG: hypothetical protein V4642_12595 [Bacteroidota bacterium]
MLIHFNDLFSSNADGTVSPTAHVEINGSKVLEGTLMELHETHIGGLALSHLRGKVLEGERKDDGMIVIRNYVRSEI